MASPIRPSDIKDTLPTTDGSACARLKKVIVDFPRRVYEWFSYIYNEDGTFTEAFKTDFCAISCDNIKQETTDPVDPDSANPGGNITTPSVEASAAMKHGGGIALVWQDVPGATKYDIYRGTTNSTTANTTVLLRKGLFTNPASMDSDKNRICRRSDNTLIYTDVNRGKIYTPNVGDQNTNSLNGSTPYYYWVVARDNSGGRSDMSPTAIGFNRYVTNYSAIGTPGLLWSGQTVAPTGLAAKTRVRVVLRGGGGAGGGGGDWMLPTFNKHWVKAITYNNGGGGDNAITLTLNQSDTAVDDFEAGDEVTIEVQGTSAWNNSEYEVDAVISDDEIKLLPIVSLGDPTASGTIQGTTTPSWGRVYATKRKNPVKVAGGGGGSGGILLAVFELTTTGSNVVDQLRVRTLDVGGTEVNYSTTSSSGFGRFELTTKSGISVLPYNEGGKARTSDATADAPKSGEPKTSSLDNNTTNTGPYKTVLEVSKDSGSNWTMVAWVADGEGGGYADDANSTMVSSQGRASVQHYWKASDNTFSATAASGYVLSRYGTKGITGCALRSASFNGAGVKFYMGAEGGKGAGAAGNYSGAGSPGWGGHAWDSFNPDTPANPLSVPYTAFNRLANAFDESAPGSGSNGSFGTSGKTKADNAYGGHALAGAAYLTYDVASNFTDYDSA